MKVNKRRFQLKREVDATCLTSNLPDVHEIKHFHLRDLPFLRQTKNPTQIFPDDPFLCWVNFNVVSLGFFRKDFIAEDFVRCI